MAVITGASAGEKPATARRLSPGERLAIALRYFFLTALLVAAVGVSGRFLFWPLLTSTIGPTAYVFAAHPQSEVARFRNATVGHGVAVAAGIGALWIFGLLHHASISATGAPSLAQVAASAVAVGVTLFVLEVIGSHHAPAAATALLISTGLAKPGPPLVGLVLGLAIVLVLGPLCGRIPFARSRASREPTPVP